MMPDKEPGDSAGSDALPGAGCAAQRGGGSPPTPLGFGSFPIPNVGKRRWELAAGKPEQGRSQVELQDGD